MIRCTHDNNQTTEAHRQVWSRGLTGIFHQPAMWQVCTQGAQESDKTMRTKNTRCDTGIELTVTQGDLQAGGDSGVLVTINTDMAGMSLNEVLTVRLRLSENGTLSVLVVENTTGQFLGVREVKSKTEYPEYVKMLAEGHEARGDWHVARALLETTTR